MQWKALFAEYAEFPTTLFSASGESQCFPVSFILSIIIIIIIIIIIVIIVMIIIIIIIDAPINWFCS